MLRRALLVCGLACLLPGLAMAETVVPLTVGDSQVRVAVADDFVKLSEKLPTVFEMEAAVQPKSNRLIEGFVSLADAKRLALGEFHQQVLLEVAVMRNTEALDFTDADWAKARPMIAKAMGQVDLKAALAGGQASANQRMSDTMGEKVAVKFGDVGKPVLYGNDPDSIRFVLLVSANVVANGKTIPYQVENAGAVVRLGNKLVLMYANRHHAAGDDTSIVRAALDGFVDRAIALNAGTAAAPATPAVHTTGCQGNSAAGSDAARCSDIPVDGNADHNPAATPAKKP